MRMVGGLGRLGHMLVYAPESEGSGTLSSGVHGQEKVDIPEDRERALPLPFCCIPTFKGLDDACSH